MRNCFLSSLQQASRIFTFPVLAIAIMFVSTEALASDAGAVIMQSLTYNPKTEMSMLDGDVAVKKLAEAGYLDARPSLRFDYSGYYFPKKPLKIFGLELVYYDYEYLERFVGCCVDDGTAIVLKPGAKMDEIERFAEKNKCRLSKDGPSYMPNKLAKLLGFNEEQQGRLIELSCKFNDRMAFDNKSKK